MRASSARFRSLMSRATTSPTVSGSVWIRLTLRLTGRSSRRGLRRKYPSREWKNPVRSRAWVSRSRPPAPGAGEEVLQAHRAGRVLLQARQPQGRGIEVDDGRVRGIEEEEGVVRLAEQAASEHEMAICRVHETCVALLSGLPPTSRAADGKDRLETRESGGDAAPPRSPAAARPRPPGGSSP